MRRSTLLTACLLAALTAAPAAFAAGNVLLPQSGGSSKTTLPNLGIVPATPAPTQTDTATEPAAAQAAAQTATPEPTADTATAPTPSVGGMSEDQAVKLLSNAYTQPPKEHQLEPAAAAIAAGKLPTTIVDEPDATELYQDKPNSLSLSISPKSTYGDRSIELINEKLGLTREQIPSACIMTVRGDVITSNGMTPVMARTASPQTVVRYDGDVTSLQLVPTVYCAARKLPSGAGYVVRSGNYFKVPLDVVFCSPPSKRPTQATVQFNDTQDARCIF